MQKEFLREGLGDDCMPADLKYALRQLWESPGFALTVVLARAVVIGVNTAVFSLMDAPVLHPLAVPDMNRVVTDPVPALRDE
jgi:hypothetical protein